MAAAHKLRAPGLCTALSLLTHSLDSQSPANNHRWLLKQPWFAFASGREECFSGEETVTPLQRLFKGKGAVFSLSQLLSEFTWCGYQEEQKKRTVSSPQFKDKATKPFRKRPQKSIGPTEPSVISKCKFGECTQVLGKYTWEISIFEYAVLI